jgi:hypothetical protein
MVTEGSTLIIVLPPTARIHRILFSAAKRRSSHSAFSAMSQLLTHNTSTKTTLNNNNSANNSTATIVTGEHVETRGRSRFRSWHFWLSRSATKGSEQRERGNKTAAVARNASHEMGKSMVAAMTSRSSVDEIAEG